MKNKKITDFMKKSKINKYYCNIKKLKNPCLMISFIKLGRLNNSNIRCFSYNISLKQ